MTDTLIFLAIFSLWNLGWLCLIWAGGPRRTVESVLEERP